MINLFRFLVSTLCGAACIVYAQSPATPGTAANSSALTALFSSRPSLTAGQSATQLPDGQWLLLGGRDSNGGAVSNAVVFNPVSQLPSPLASRLVQARSGHTATLMPDGTVLILGGVDSSGNVLATPEEFDPLSQQFRTVNDLGLIARSGHAATILPMVGC